MNKLLFSILILPGFTSLAFSYPCQNEADIIDKHGFAEKAGKNITVSYDNGKKESFVALFGEPTDIDGEPKEITFCLMGYFSEYHALVIKESGFEWSKFHWVNMENGARTQIGRELLFSPDKKRIASFTCDEIASGINVVGIWRIKKGVIEEEYFQEFQGNEKYITHMKWEDNKNIGFYSGPISYGQKDIPTDRVFRKVGVKWKTFPK